MVLAMARRRFSGLVDHVLTWILAVPLALMSLGLLIGPYVSQPQVHSGLSATALFWGIAFGYGAAAVIQQHYGLIPAWRPSWSQGLGVVWFGGWTILLVLYIVRDLILYGWVWDHQFPALLLGSLFVAIPLISARFLVRREQHSGYIHE
jgi:hypothetical protein